MNALAVNEIRGATWTLVHNAYLEYAVELGLAGLFLFLMLLVTCLRTVRRVRWRAQARPDLAELSWLAEGISIALVAFAVAAFFHPVAYHFYFYCLAGLAIAAGVLCDRHLGER
jgi:O-antigen ligase